MESTIQELELKTDFKIRFIKFRQVLRRLGLIGNEAWPRLETAITAWVDRNVQYKMRIYGHNSNIQNSS